MTLHIGDLNLTSIGFFAALLLQATFTYAVSGFWPLRKLGWYRNCSAIASAIPLGHSLLSSQPDLLKVTATFLGTLMGLVVATWIAEKSNKTGKIIWSLMSLTLVTTIACYSDMKGSTAFYSGALVMFLLNMALKAWWRDDSNQASDTAVPIRMVRGRQFVERGPASSGIMLPGWNQRGTTPHIPQSRLNWHPRNN